MKEVCKTCEEIEFWKAQKNQDFKQKLFAKICYYTWSKEQRAVRGKQIGSYTGRAKELNYCPTCGVKLKG